MLYSVPLNNVRTRGSWLKTCRETIASRGNWPPNHPHYFIRFTLGRLSAAYSWTFKAIDQCMHLSPRLMYMHRNCFARNCRLDYFTKDSIVPQRSNKTCTVYSRLTWTKAIKNKHSCIQVTRLTSDKNISYTIRRNTTQMQSNFPYAYYNWTWCTLFISAILLSSVNGLGELTCWLRAISLRRTEFRLSAIYCAMHCAMHCRVWAVPFAHVFSSSLQYIAQYISQ